MSELNLFPIANLLLPEVLVAYFDLTNHTLSEDELHFYFQESNILPQEYKQGEVTSKGFHKEVTIQDFPLRGRQVYLHVKRRRWQDNNTGSVVSRNWNLVAKGTRMTKEFADFLK
jgi:hypothetical protein